MLDHWPDVNFPILLGLLTLIVFDLILRYLLFGQLESAAIDAALFSTAYSTVEANRELLNAVGHTFDRSDLFWLRRAIVCAVCLVLLAFTHSLLDRRLRLIVEELYDDLYEKLVERAETDDQARTARKLLRAAKPFLMRSTLLTFIGPEARFRDRTWIRRGKQDWRKETANFIKLIDAEAPEDLSADNLLLSPPYRALGLAAFALLGLIATLAPAITLN